MQTEVIDDGDGIEEQQPQLQVFYAPVMTEDVQESSKHFATSNAAISLRFTGKNRSDTVNKVADQIT